MLRLRGVFAVVVLVAACGLRSVPVRDSGAGGAGGAGGTGGAGGAGGTGGTAGGGTCTRTEDCPAPANSTPACDNGTCTFECAPPYLRCPASCCPVVALSAGESHTCALTDGGEVLCWGAMFAVGDGTYAQRSRPTAVVGLGPAATAVSAGNLNTCAIDSAGGVKCWGAGPIGNGLNAPQPQATQVTGLYSGVTSLSSGGTHVCAVADAGARCWGRESQGELGCGQCGLQLDPGDVTGLVYDVKQVACGVSHCCGLLHDGGVWCWGVNQAGECGDGQPGVRHFVPAQAVVFDGGADEIYAGYGLTCARSGTSLRCVGSNSDGLCGCGQSAFNGTIARPVLLGAGLTAVGTGPLAFHACAVVDAGVWCWGRNDKGQLGDGMMTSRNTPVRALGLSEPVVSVAVGGAHSCAVTAGGGVWCWGSNSNGQLGNGAIGGNALSPVQVR